MNSIRAAFILGLASISSSAFAASHLIYLGTYTRSPSTSEGIYSIRLDDDTGALSTPVLAAKATNPAWITFSPDKKFLYTLHPSTAQIIGFKVDPSAGKLTPLPVPAAGEAAPPSFVAVDATGTMAFGANYADGYLDVLRIDADGTLSKPTIIRHSGRSVHPRQNQPHVHSVTVSPDNRFIIVCDLGLDKVFTYAINPGAGTAVPANPPSVSIEPGSGPRHFKFSADGKHAYSMNEIASTITTFDYEKETGALKPRQTSSTLPADFKGESTAAEIRVHPSGKFVYASNRGHDSIAVFSADPTTGFLSRVEVVPSGGKTPRNFAISPDGNWMVCGHQDSHNLTVFRINQDNGRLEKTAHTATVPAAVCVLFYD